MTQRVEKGLGSDFYHTDAEKRWFIDSFGLREEWYTFLVTLEHIQFERMDDEQEFDGMMLRLVDGDRGRFLLWHMMATDFQWNIIGHHSFRSKYAAYL
jgi:hypothetical protein